MAAISTTSVNWTITQQLAKSKETREKWDESFSQKQAAIAAEIGVSVAKAFWADMSERLSPFQSLPLWEPIGIFVDLNLESIVQFAPRNWNLYPWFQELEQNRSQELIAYLQNKLDYISSTAQIQALSLLEQLRLRPGNSRLCSPLVKWNNTSYYKDGIPSTRITASMRLHRGPKPQVSSASVPDYQIG